MSLLPNLGATLREAEKVLAAHSNASAFPPVVIWQRPTEEQEALRARVLAVRGRLDARAPILAVVTPEVALLAPGVRLVHLPAKHHGLLTPHRKSRYRCASGGRGSAKSHSIATAIVLRALAGRIRVLCAREIMRSLRESVHHLLCDKIDDMGLTRFFDITDRSITCTATGSEVLFAGLFANVTALKSLENISLVWLEEGESVAARSLEVLTPTIRGRDSEIWISANPDNPDAPVQDFIEGRRPGVLHAHTIFSDNDYFPQVLEAERAYLERVDPDAYAHVWLGECRKASDAQVLKNKYTVDAFSPLDSWNGPYFGLDFGFSQDPTAAVKAWIHQRRLYIEYEVWQIGCDIDATPRLLDQIPDSRRYTMRADCSRPETISWLVRNGFGRTVGVEKWPGSVEDGIAHLRSYEQIVIHPRCTHMAEEARLYSYKEDRQTGDVLPDVADKHNHCIDALRYALQPLIRAGNSGWLIYMRQQVAAMNERKRGGREP